MSVFAWSVTGIAVRVFWSRLYCHSYALRWPADFATRCAVPGTGPDSGDSKRSAVVTADEEWLHRLVAPLPFEGSTSSCRCQEDPRPRSSAGAASSVSLE